MRTKRINLTTNLQLSSRCFLMIITCDSYKIYLKIHYLFYLCNILFHVCRLTRLSLDCCSSLTGPGLINIATSCPNLRSAIFQSFVATLNKDNLKWKVGLEIKIYVIVNKVLHKDGFFTLNSYMDISLNIFINFFLLDKDYSISNNHEKQYTKLSLDIAFI